MRWTLGLYTNLRASILGAVPFLVFYHSRALIEEGNEQWLRYKAEFILAHHILSIVFLCLPGIYPRYVRSTQRKGAKWYSSCSIKICLMSTCRNFCCYICLEWRFSLFSAKKQGCKLETMQEVILLPLGRAWLMVWRGRAEGLPCSVYLQLWGGRQEEVWPVLAFRKRLSDPIWLPHSDQSRRGEHEPL